MNQHNVQCIAQIKSLSEHGLYIVQVDFRNPSSIQPAASESSCRFLTLLDMQSRFVAAVHHGLRLSSRDGSQWTSVQTGKEGEIYRAVAFGNRRFVAVGSYGGASIFASTADGESWDTSAHALSHRLMTGH